MCLLKERTDKASDVLNLPGCLLNQASQTGGQQMGLFPMVSLFMQIA